MSHLKNKSEINLVAAETLFKENMYPSCCHPAYYSCLQLMKYAINERIGVSYSQQENEVKYLDKRVSRSGSHNYLIDKIASTLKDFEIDESLAFKRDIEDLKILREDADYKNIQIGRDHGERAIRLARRINTQLFKIFKI